AAFVRDVDGSPSDFISVCFREEGETEPGSDHEWTQDAYEIIVSRSDGTQHREIGTDVSQTAELVAEEMVSIAA
ncbi:hypothetical protein, partial [Halorubrum sp. SP3]